MGSRATVTAVNVPFADLIDEDELALALARARPGTQWGGHVSRMLSELPAGEIVRFCDRHGIAKHVLRATYQAFDGFLRLGNRDLEDWLSEP